MASPDKRNPMKLSQWNQERHQYWEEVRRKVTAPETVPNGLLCDICGGSMFDTGQTEGRPVRMRVKCIGCGLLDYRLE